MDKQNNGNSNFLTILAFYILKSIWSAINKSRFEGKEPIINYILHKAILNMNIWFKALDSLLLKDSRIVSSNTGSLTQWIPHPPSWIKISFYGSLQGSTGAGMAVAIVRDSNGKELGAITKKVQAQSVGS